MAPLAINPTWHLKGEMLSRKSGSYSVQGKITKLIFKVNTITQDSAETSLWLMGKVS